MHVSAAATENGQQRRAGDHRMDTENGQHHHQHGHCQKRDPARDDAAIDTGNQRCKATRLDGKKGHQHGRCNHHDVICGAIHRVTRIGQDGPHLVPMA